MLRSSLLLGVLGLTRTMACTLESDESFTVEVLYCENAVEHAVPCCPELKPLRQSCRYTSDTRNGPCGCTDMKPASRTEAIVPGLTRIDSEKILASSCARIRADDGCAQLQAKLVSRNTERSSVDVLCGE